MLCGEAAETIKGLGYTQAAYDAAKDRLHREYGGDRRKLQAQIDELRKLKSVIEGDPKAMDKFASILEKTVVVLKRQLSSCRFRGQDLKGNCCREIA